MMNSFLQLSYPDTPIELTVVGDTDAKEDRCTLPRDAEDPMGIVVGLMAVRRLCVPEVLLGPFDELELLRKIVPLTAAYLEDRFRAYLGRRLDALERAKNTQSSGDALLPDRTTRAEAAEVVRLLDEASFAQVQAIEEEDMARAITLNIPSIRDAMLRTLRKVPTPR